MADERPGYWEIILAYIQEGHRAWKDRKPAYAVEVEQRLGLSQIEGLRYVEYLKRRALIQDEMGMNALGAYHLLPDGLALAEAVPSLEQFLASRTATIQKVEGPSAAEKTTAIRSMRDTAIKAFISEGLAELRKQFPRLYRLLRTQFPWLPDLGMEDVTL